MKRLAPGPAPAPAPAPGPAPALALTLVLALALVLVPGAQAHFEETNLNAGRLEAGPFVVSFTTAPAVLYQHASTTFSVQAAPASTGTPTRGDEVSISASVLGPGPHSETKEMLPDGRGFYLASFTFPETGVYSVGIDVRSRDGSEQGTASTEVEVFPDLPIRIRPLDLALIVYANRTTTFDFEIVNATLLTRVDTVEDLQMRLEHWADDHARKISEQEITGTRLGQGLWRFQATPSSSGMHHIRFASESGGFNYAQSPPLHAYVDPETADQPAFEPEGADTPFAGLALLAGAVGVALLLSRRR